MPTAIEPAVAAVLEEIETERYRRGLRTPDTCHCGPAPWNGPGSSFPLLRVRQAHQPIDEAAEVGAQLGRGHPAGERGVVPDRDLRQHPGELGGRQAPILPLASGEGFRQREAETFERADVDQIADLRASEQCAQLVGEDLLGRDRRE